MKKDLANGNKYDCSMFKCECAYSVCVFKLLHCALSWWCCVRLTCMHELGGELLRRTNDIMRTQNNGVRYKTTNRVHIIGKQNSIEKRKSFRWELQHYYTQVLRFSQLCLIGFVFFFISIITIEVNLLYAHACM